MNILIVKSKICGGISSIKEAEKYSPSVQAMLCLLCYYGKSSSLRRCHLGKSSRWFIQDRKVHFKAIIHLFLMELQTIDCPSVTKIDFAIALSASFVSVLYNNNNNNNKHFI